MRPELSENRYSKVRDKILDGYVLALRNPGIITFGTLGSASHIGIAKREYDSLVTGEFTLQMIEARELKDIRSVTLSSQVERYPGRIDVYKPLCGPEIRHKAAVLANRQTGKHYDYRGLWRVAVLRAIGLHWLFGAKPSDPDKRAPWDSDKFCSFMADWVFDLASGGKFRLVYGVNSSEVVPAQVEQSGSCRLLIRGLVP